MEWTMPKTTDAEVRFSIDADFLKSLQDRLGVDKATDVARSALTPLVMPELAQTTKS
jgi:hypothetical protein